jgi:hypothetical protein
MTFRRTKLLVVAALAAASIPAVPAPAGAALGPCRVVETGVGTTLRPGWEEVAIAGFYTAPAGAIGVELTCGVVADERVYASASDELPGPVAALAGTGSVPTNASIETCYTLRVAYLTHSYSTNTCP